MEMDFSFSEELYQMIFWPYSHWPANSLTHELHMLEKKDKNHPTSNYRWAEDRYQSNLGFNNTSAVPQANELHQYSQYLNEHTFQIFL